jgi:lysophospholipase L1-like esterase
MRAKLVRKALWGLLAALSFMLCVELAALAWQMYFAPRFPTDTPKPVHVLLAGDCSTTNLAPLLRAALWPDYYVSRIPEHVNSDQLLAKLDDLVIAKKPDIFYFNVGLGDATRIKGKHITPIDAYEKNLTEIIRRVRATTKARIIWVSTVAVVDEWRKRAAGPHGPVVANSDVDPYNAAALRVMTENRVECFDLNAFMWQAGPEEVVMQDGLHPVEEMYPTICRIACAQIKSGGARDGIGN